MAQNQRFLACWANFFAEVPLEGLCWANYFAVSPRRRVVGRVLLRCCGLVCSWRHAGVAKAADLEGVPKFACNSLRASCRFVLVRDAVSLVFWSCMRNWGRARYWGEVGCWCVTFFALLGLVVVEAVQNSPCWLKVGRKGVFRACRESFVPGGPDGAACWESFVPAPASRAVQSSPCVACYWREREKILPACGKWAEIGVFVCVGRVLCRLGLPGLPVGRVLCRWGASWRGARDRCELTVGTKGPAARAAGRMDASVSVVLGITGRCPTISHAIPCEHRAGLCQFIMSRHLCFGIACEIGGGLVTGVAGGVLGVHGQRVLGDALAKRMGARAGSEIGHAPAVRSGAHRPISRAPVHI